jgi:type II restriction enzyme
LSILESVGQPVHSYTARVAEKVAFAFLALGDLSPGDAWSRTRDITQHELTTRGILRWAREHYGEVRSDGSYDYVLRVDLRDMLTSGLVQNTGRLAGKSYNDSTRGYGLEPGFARLVRTYGSPQWENSLRTFLSNRPAFAEAAGQPRVVAMTVEGRSLDGREIRLELGPGGHNDLIKDSVDEFLGRWAPDAVLLYLGDADDRDLWRDESALESLGIDLEDVLPDVLAFSPSRGWLIVIEAVHSRGPVSHEKHRRFQEILHNWAERVVYVTTFADRAGFRRFIAEIAWETEVWLAAEPEHLIHFNGERFLGPHPASS